MRYLDPLDEVAIMMKAHVCSSSSFLPRDEASMLLVVLRTQARPLAVAFIESKYLDPPTYLC